MFRRKIACLLGAGARDTSNEGWITTVVTRMMPSGMKEFSDEYVRAARNVDDESDCQQMECSKCFGV
jgi:hypothetical protein